MTEGRREGPRKGEGEHAYVFKYEMGKRDGDVEMRDGVEGIIGRAEKAVERARREREREREERLRAERESGVWSFSEWKEKLDEA